MQDIFVIALGICMFLYAWKRRFDGKHYRKHAIIHGAGITITFIWLITLISLRPTTEMEIPKKEKIINQSIDNTASSIR